MHIIQTLISGVLRGRTLAWRTYNYLGWMLRKGLLSVEDLYDSVGPYSIGFYVKYKPILDGVRERYNGWEYLKDYDFFVLEMAKYVRLRDPSFQIPNLFFQLLPET